MGERGVLGYSALYLSPIEYALYLPSFPQASEDHSKEDKYDATTQALVDAADAARKEFDVVDRTYRLVLIIHQQISRLFFIAATV